MIFEGRKQQRPPAPAASVRSDDCAAAFERTARRASSPGEPLGTAGRWATRTRFKADQQMEVASGGARSGVGWRPRVTRASLSDGPQSGPWPNRLTWAVAAECKGEGGRLAILPPLPLLVDLSGQKVNFDLDSGLEHGLNCDLCSSN